MTSTSLVGALPELRTAYGKLDAYAKTLGVGIAVADFGGVRTLADTTRILKYRDDDYALALRQRTIPADTTINRFRPIAPFGSSYHNYGAAFDIRIVSRPSNLTAEQALGRLGAYAPNAGLRWGGKFSNPDWPHFELPITLEEARRRYSSAGGTLAPPQDTGFSFDLSKLLPGLTPAAPDEYTPDVEAADWPEIDTGVAAAGESGELVNDQIPNDGSMGIILAGVAVAGFLVWALRRHFT